MDFIHHPKRPLLLGWLGVEAQIQIHINNCYIPFARNFVQAQHQRPVIFISCRWIRVEYNWAFPSFLRCGNNILQRCLCCDDRSGFLPLAVPSIGRNDIHTIVQKEDQYASKTR